MAVSLLEVICRLNCGEVSQFFFVCFLSFQQIETPHHNFDYDSILTFTPIAIPASMEMKCVPKPDLDEITNYDDEVSVAIGWRYNTVVMG